MQKQTARDNKKLKKKKKKKKQVKWMVLSPFETVMFQKEKWQINSVGIPAVF